MPAETQQFKSSGMQSVTVPNSGVPKQSALYQQLAARHLQQQTNQRYDFRFDADTPQGMSSREQTQLSSKKGAQTHHKTSQQNGPYGHQHQHQHSRNPSLSHTQARQQSQNVNARRPPKASASRSPNRMIGNDSQYATMPYQFNPNLARSMYTVSQHLDNAPVVSQGDQSRTRSHRERNARGPQYQQMSASRNQPDRRTGLHETPATGSIEDLSINIMDLQPPSHQSSIANNRDNPVPPPRRNDRESTSYQNGPQAPQQKNQNYVSSTTSSKVHLQLDFERNTIHSVERQVKTVPTSVTNQQQQQSSTTSQNQRKENTFLPQSPKISTKADVEKQLQRLSQSYHQNQNNQSLHSSQGSNQLQYHSQHNPHHPRMLQEQQQKLSTSIDKTELQIAMPNNSTVTIMQHHHHVTTSTKHHEDPPQNQSRIVTIAETAKTYSIPDQQTKTSHSNRNQIQSKQKSSTGLSSYLSRQKPQTSATGAGGGPGRSQQIQQKSTRYHETTAQGKTSNVTSTNRNVANRSMTASHSSTRKVQKPGNSKPTYYTDELEQKLSRKFEMRFQAQEQRFMTILEKVIESNEIVKDQLLCQIDSLSTKVNSLEAQLRKHKQQTASAPQEPRITSSPMISGPPEVWQTEHTEIRSGEQYLLSEDEVEGFEYQAQPHEVGDQHFQQPEAPKGALNRPRGAHDLILVDGQAPNTDMNHFLMLGGGDVPYSPISQLDGIDFGKVLSTKSNRTFINELNGQKNKFEDANVSPLPKLNLSVLQDMNNNQQATNKSITRREQELLKRLNELKRSQSKPRQNDEGDADQHQIVDQSGFDNSQNGEPKFIYHIARQTSSISRNNNQGFNNTVMKSSNDSGGNVPGYTTVGYTQTVPHMMSGGINSEQNTLLQHIGEMTGRSENVQDTHRSSMVDMRHLEQQSLKPVSREATIDNGYHENGDVLAGDIVIVANEQKTMKEKYQRIRNKRTNSLHQSRDASFLSTYNASLVGMNTSMNGGTSKSNQAKSKQLKQTAVNQKLTLQMMKDEYRDDEGGVSEVNREGQLQSQQQIVVSPLSRSNFDYFSQNKVVSLLNQQKGGAGQSESSGQKVGNSHGLEIVDEPSEAVRDEAEKATRAGPHKTKSRSASYHFTMEGSSEIALTQQNNFIGDKSEYGQKETPVKKQNRQTHTSVVQNNRRVSDSLQDTEKQVTKNSGRSALMSVQLRSRAKEEPQVERCTCTRPPLASNLFMNGGIVRNNQTARVRHDEGQSVPSTPLRDVLSVERLSSAHIHREIPNSTSKNENQQTEIIETIADEDVPLKVINNGGQESEVKLTEVDKVLPSMPQSVRMQASTPKNQPQSSLEGMFKNMEPCGEFCQWLSAEAQRDIIRGILTSTQGNTTLKASQGKPGEKRFLVNAVWWRKWTDYVNFDLVESEPPSTQQEHLRQERKKSRSASRHNSAKKQNNNTSFIGSQDGSYVDNAAGAQQQSNFMNELMSLKKSKSNTRKPSHQQQVHSSKTNNVMVSPVAVTAADLDLPESHRHQVPNIQPQVANNRVLPQPPPQDGTTYNTTVEEEEFNEAAKDSEEETLARAIPSIKNSGVTMRTSNNLNLYARPGPVENHDLLQKNNCLLVKNNLIEHHDYVALPSPIWKHIYQWYSADWSIVRFLRKDATQGVILDLNPSHEAVHRIETTHMDTDGEGANADIDNKSPSKFL